MAQKRWCTRRLGEYQQSRHRSGAGKRNDESPRRSTRRPHHRLPLCVARGLSAADRNVSDREWSLAEPTGGQATAAARTGFK